jgi:porin
MIDPFRNAVKSKRPGILLLGSLLFACGAQAEDIWQPAQYGKDLVASGIRPHAYLFSESASNVKGGDERGFATSYQIMAGADFDLQKLFGVDNAWIHFLVNRRSGDSLNAEHIGSTFGPQESYGVENTRLQELTWDQSFFNGKVEVRAGRMSIITSDFFGSNAPTFCQFQSEGVCASPYAFGRNNSNSIWPIATWAANVKYNITPEYYVRLGVSEDNKFQAGLDQHGLNWNTHEKTGLYIPLELGYRTSLKNDAYPTWLRGGVGFDTSKYVNPYEDSQGNPYQLSKQAADTEKGRQTYWVQLDQSIWRPEPANAARGVNLIAGAVFAGDDSQNIEHQLYGGLIYKGPFASRPNDTAGLLINNFKMSDSRYKYTTTGRDLLGGDQSIHRDTFNMELNYGYQLTPWIMLKPNLQVSIHPMQINSATQDNVADYVVVGLQAVVNVDKLLGIPDIPFSR